MVQIFMRDLKKVSALWSVRFRLSALERFCYKGFLRNSSETNFFVRLREVSALEDVRFRKVPLYKNLTKPLCDSSDMIVGMSFQYLQKTYICVIGTVLIHQINFQLVMDLVTNNHLMMDYFQSLNWCHKQFVPLMFVYRL